MSSSVLKYPRTSYSPWSPSMSAKQVHPGMEFFLNKDVVITEKIDGSNTCLFHGEVYSRATNTPTCNKWFAMVKAHHAYKTLDLDLMIHGEDIFGVHSIEYGPVKENCTFYEFGISDKNYFLSWQDTEEYCKLLDMPTAFVIFRGRFSSVEDIREFLASEHNKPSFLGDTREGVVMRLASQFERSDFSRSVVKSVRPNHVQTDSHWRYNWRQCRLK